MANNNKETKSDYKTIAICVSIITIFIWALSFLLFTTSWDKDERGTFGDMFGAVNALFSGLAFAGLIGISSIALKFLLIAFGATSIFKSIKQYSRMSSNIKYLLAKQELKFTGLKMDKLKK